MRSSLTKWDDFNKLAKVSSPIDSVPTTTVKESNLYDLKGVRSHKTDKNGNSSHELTAGITTTLSKAASGSTAPTISYVIGHQLLGVSTSDVKKPVLVARRRLAATLLGSASQVPHDGSALQLAAVRLRKPQALPLRYPPGLAIDAPRRLEGEAVTVPVGRAFQPLHPAWQSNRPAQATRWPPGSVSSPTPRTLPNLGVARAAHSLDLLD